ncbi:hypothetical protein C1280_11665 [Gemmata obscuriglobus]|uniref:Uncharacterized protein n=1 Tax=Gemmata obscuriglobus TaxID=114 RepID=A0A2Z3HK60_9BACT|nr:hypothetical protein C1280_11665 [Gemmata obscuriglobus]
MALRQHRSVVGAARRREWGWWVASDVRRHGAPGRRCSAWPHRWRGHPRMRGADVSEPNPALHLTPPADLERTAHSAMAVQVSLLFGGGGADAVLAACSRPR